MNRLLQRLAGGTPDNFTYVYENLGFDLRAEPANHEMGDLAVGDRCFLVSQQINLSIE